MHGTFDKPKPVRRRICYVVRKQTLQGSHPNGSPIWEHSGWERVSVEMYTLKLECSVGKRHKVGGLVEDFEGNGLHGRAIYAWHQIHDWDNDLKQLYYAFLEEHIATSQAETETRLEAV